MANMTWDVFEDNGGGLHLRVWRDGERLYYHCYSGYEGCEAQCADDVRALMGGDDAADWDGNEIDDWQSISEWDSLLLDCDADWDGTLRAEADYPGYAGHELYRSLGLTCSADDDE